jgi:fimbrial chaperone protein
MLWYIFAMQFKQFNYSSIIMLLLLSTLVIPDVSSAGEWRISPTRLDLDRENKNGELTVRNEGDEKVNLQIKAVEWTQDQEGKDRYNDTAELLFFPKMLNLVKNDDKIIRTGVPSVPVSREKTFRLMVQEIPSPRKTATPTVAIALKFSVPIFVKPLREDLKGEVDKIELSQGTLSVLVKNSGNSHFRIATIGVSGKSTTGEPTFSRTVDGWYLLSGASRSYTIPLPAAECAKSSLLEVLVKADRLNLEKTFQVDKKLCSP